VYTIFPKKILEKFSENWEIHKKWKKIFDKNYTILRKKHKKFFYQIFIYMEYKCVVCGDCEVINFYPKRKNKCKSCMSNEYKNREDKEDYINKQRKWRSNNLIHYRVESAKHRALRKGIVFEITDEDIVNKLSEQNNKCYISKQTISMIENDWYSLSLDRLDNSLGYTKDNTIVVTKFVNSSKNDLPLNIFLKMLKEVCDNTVQ